MTEKEYRIFKMNLNMNGFELSIVVGEYRTYVKLEHSMLGMLHHIIMITDESIEAYSIKTVSDYDLVEHVNTEKTVHGGVYFGGDELKFILKTFDNYYDIVNFESEKKKLKLSDLPKFTGLYDKYSKPMYSYDIIKSSDGKLMLIKWNDAEAGFMLECKTCAFGHKFGVDVKCDDIEIVGNITDNPELFNN